MLQIPYKYTSRRAGDVASVYADPKLAASDLGWTADMNLDEMCECLLLCDGIQSFLIHTANHNFSSVSLHVIYYNNRFPPEAVYSQIALQRTPREVRRVVTIERCIRTENFPIS